MSHGEIRRRVIEILSEELALESEQVKGITDESTLVQDLGADSLDTVELVMAIEEEFAIEISDEDAEKLDTVGKLIAHVQGAVETGGSGDDDGEDEDWSEEEVDGA